ncbi:MAG TPA: hypothetical protein QGG91_04465 [Flavobacteriales bacterium]|jgi:predicted small lipoprotein YifL|nr:hypothetical protein [Flavobacteriales bacterium]|tara:strand:+ start:5240 stop:5791 length:552 start_codon:yes stop_codon:yes gene_type:complete
MKNLINILGVLLFVFSIISCGNNENDKNANTLTEDQISASDLNKNGKIIKTKKSLFSSYAEHFEYTPEYEMLNITKIILPNLANMGPTPGDEKLCEEIKKLIGDNQLIFNSNEECRQGKYVNKYRILQKGTIKIGDNDYTASLYYNDHSREAEKKAFEGIIIIELSTITSSLPEGELIISTKR